MASFVDMESIIRPFVKDPPSNPNPPEPESVEEETASITWTATADIETTTIPALGYSFNFPEDDEDEDNFARVEVDRVTSTKRVENPDDSEQYVDVEVVDEVVFSVGGKARRRYRLNNE